jgi:hypothetical protein
MRPMSDVAVLAVLIAIVVAAAMARRRKVAERTTRAATVELVVDDQLVRRRLGDGREEFARWSLVQSVEVVCTPVRTADGARAFALIAEGPESGCLVPLGVGHDEALLVELSRLPGFRLRDFGEAREHRPPHRTMVWTRRAPQPPD